MDNLLIVDDVTGTVHRIHPGLLNILRKLKIVKGTDIVWKTDGCGDIGSRGANRPAKIYMSIKTSI